MSKPLAGRVCVVTGATRGIGRGIALQLGENGAKVYITGRTIDPIKGSKVGGSLRETTEEIEARGGTCIPVQCDHANDEEVERLFKQIERENDGQLDVFVNNAFSAVNAIFYSLDKTFWEQPVSMWDEVNKVGLRNHYLCAVYAARMMIPRKRGLIVNISSCAGLTYTFNVPYGIGKEACDRMATDCAFELHKFNVAFVSLWPGAVGTENLTSIMQEQSQDIHQSATVGEAPIKIDIKQKIELLSTCETTQFVGKCIVMLAMDADIMRKSGRILFTCDLAREYGLKDDPGHVPFDSRQMKYMLWTCGYVKTARLVPGFIRMPKWLYYLTGYKL